jgi:hypothetical protein
MPLHGKNQPINAGEIPGMFGEMNELAVDRQNDGLREIGVPNGV